MPIKAHAIGLGTPPLQASALIGGGNFALTATGSTLSTALLISASTNEFTTVATATGARLPAADPGDSVYVYNGGALALLVYPDVAANSISNGSAGVGFSVAANKGCVFRKVSSTRWGQNLSA